jgi:DNA helicase II / ATP-dependent DNA helicase PcrA
MTVPLDDLNPEQRQAVLYDGPSLMVMAGPGSGKTRVVTRRIAYRILEGHTPPSRILAVTFTNRAAHEMSNRVQALVEGGPRVPIGTFHWMCAGILRRRIAVLGYRPDFRLLKPWEARKLLQSLLSEDRADSSASLSSLAEAVSGLKSGVDMERLVERSGIAAERLRHVAGAYARALRAHNALDLDDLPLLAAAVLREHPHLRGLCRAAIDELLVDEYQDTNAVQQELVELLAPQRGTVVVVGDEDQAIYGWRHADARGFQRFQQAFPAGEVVVLQRSYRHHKFVARAANELIARHPNRTQKAIHTELPAGERPVCFVAVDERDEAEWIADEIGRLAAAGKVAWEDIAILYRINAQSRALEEALIQRNIPYRVLSGHSFYARPHIQRVLAYLRLALDRDDDAAAALLVRTVPGMGAARIEELRNRATGDGISLVTALAAVDRMTTFPHKVRLALAALGTQISGVAAVRKGPLSSAVDAALEAAERGLDEEGLLTESVHEDFGELRSMTRAHQQGRGTLRTLTDRLALDVRENNVPHGVNLLSLHSAKGLEYRVVFLSGLEEGVLPHARSLPRAEDVEEERRLCYVGMTRAKEILYLSYAQARLLGGRATTGQPSRFIREIGLHNMALKVSTAKRVKPRLATAGAGDRVYHAHWGAGTVEQVDGTGLDMVTTVLFDTGGRRRLQLCHAPLTLHREGPADVAAG